MLKRRVLCIDVIQHTPSAKEVYLRTARTIETLKQGDHHIIAADNGWHTGVKMENVRWYCKAINYYGKY